MTSQQIFNQAAPMVTQDLDNVECNNPTCEIDHPLFFHPQCHREAGADVSYFLGVMTMRCHKCQIILCKVQVATADVQ